MKTTWERKQNGLFSIVLYEIHMYEIFSMLSGVQFILFSYVFLKLSNLIAPEQKILEMINEKFCLLLNKSIWVLFGSFISLETIEHIKHIDWVLNECLRLWWLLPTFFKNIFSSKTNQVLPSINKVELTTAGVLSWGQHHSLQS